MKGILFSATLGNIKKNPLPIIKESGERAEKGEMRGVPYLRDEPIVQLTTGHPQVDLVAEVSVAAVGVAKIL